MSYNPRGNSPIVSSTATLSAEIDVDKTPATTLLAANPDRKGVVITVLGKDSYIKLQAASVDNNQTGIFVKKNLTWDMSGGSVYTGEISAVGKDNNSKVFVTEW